jgi:2-keto-4-pentenoate hydratase/2-oxohepta-3-ene-1,7-dioic acid hydratase in catechol pathway
MRIVSPSKIVCVGRNYAEHAKELGNVLPEKPLLFFKPPSAIIGHGEPIVLPPESTQVEHECEIGVIVGQRVRRVSPDEARAAIGGITCANDVTARDLQKTDGQWTRAKGFDTFCPVGPCILPVDHRSDLTTLEVTCRVNGEVRQHGRASEMAFSIPVLLSYISTIMTLEQGDLLLTGTPAGVGPLVAGDVVEVEIPGVGVLQNPVTAAR